MWYAIWPSTSFSEFTETVGCKRLVQVRWSKCRVRKCSCLCYAMCGNKQLRPPMFCTMNCIGWPDSAGEKKCPRSYQFQCYEQPSISKLDTYRSAMPFLSGPTEKPFSSIASREAVRFRRVDYIFLLTKTLFFAWPFERHVSLGIYLLIVFTHTCFPCPDPRKSISYCRIC